MEHCKIVPGHQRETHCGTYRRKHIAFDQLFFGLPSRLNFFQFQVARFSFVTPPTNQPTEPKWTNWTVHFHIAIYWHWKLGLRGWWFDDDGDEVVRFTKTTFFCSRKLETNRLEHEKSHLNLHSSSRTNKRMRARKCVREIFDRKWASTCKTCQNREMVRVEVPRFFSSFIVHKCTKKLALSIRELLAISRKGYQNVYDPVSKETGSRVPMVGPGTIKVSCEVIDQH